MVAPRPESPPQLNILPIIVGCLTAWAIGCFVVHGSVIFAYIGLQAMTAGVFTWSMCRVEKNAQSRRPSAIQTPQHATPAPDSTSTDEPVRKTAVTTG
jgi:hypothetical protein